MATSDNSTDGRGIISGGYLNQDRPMTRETWLAEVFPEWGTFLKNKHLASALFDRLTATTHVFNMKDCESLRPRLNESSEGDAA